jgi:hypothetical protein
MVHFNLCSFNAIIYKSLDEKILNLGVITSFSNKEVFSMSPILSLKYTNFSSWTKALSKYLLYAHLWRYTREPLLPFGLYHEENNS